MGSHYILACPEPQRTREKVNPSGQRCMGQGGRVAGWSGRPWTASFPPYFVSSVPRKERTGLKVSLE